MDAWAETDPSAAIQWFTDHQQTSDNPTAQRSDPQMRLFSNWLSSDETAARKWLSANPSHSLAQRAHDALAMHLVNSGRSEEALRAFNRFPSEKNADLALVLAGAITEDDPVAAGDWVASLPPGVAQNAAIGGVIFQWAERDPGACAEWITEFPAGDSKDRAMAAYADTLSSKTPSIAAEWVEQIQDSYRRTVAAKATFRSWRTSDPRAAVEWFRNVSGILEVIRADELRYE